MHGLGLGCRAKRSAVEKTAYGSLGGGAVERFGEPDAAKAGIKVGK